MIRLSNYTICLLLFVCCLSSCQKKEFEAIFDRPKTLADPIYQQLEARKNFTNLLACIDKAGLKTILGTSGYWTFFAPNDEAFKAYFQSVGKSGISDIDSVTAADIVTYGLVLNAYRKDQLSMTQTSKGPTPGTAYRRKTYYYDFVYKDPGHSGMTVGNNRNVTYVANDNNNKYISYFLDPYMSFGGLSASDYSSFYPGSTYSGFNVAGANVITADIPAENGIIHEIDKVISPVPNIEQYVANKPEYSEFKKLLDRVAVYTYNSALTKKYNALTGKTDSVFVKSYPNTLSFAPNNEGYLAVTQTDGQEQAWTAAIPTNAALQAWQKEILVNLSTFDQAPPSVLIDLINSFLWTTAVWPADILTTTNAQVQAASFTASDIVDKKVLSNGIFYGTSVAHQSNIFRTVYGKAYLDPKYSLMTRAFGESDLKVVSMNAALKFTLFMMSNTEIQKLGYTFNTDQGQWSYVNPATPTATPAMSLTQDRLNRIAQTSAVLTPKGEFDNLSGEGIAESFGGEYVKFKNNKVYASGNIVNGTSVTIDSSKTTFNGKVYYTKGLLEFAESTETLGQSIERLALSTDPLVANNFNYFYQYMINSASLWSPITKDIIGVPVGAFYTAFIPSNAAIMQAVKDGLLPGNKTTGMPTFAGGSQTTVEQAQVSDFILYHILNKNTVAVDGKKYGLFQSMLNDSAGDPKLVSVFYPGSDPVNYVPSEMEIRDRLFPNSTAAQINLPYSNNLANRALIHSINKVLNFN